MLVGAVVIQHEVNVERSIDGLVNSVEESQKLLMTMAWLAFADHGSFRHVQCGKQSRGPRALIVMGLAPGQTRP
jgi:hypothetical protein